ncbi:Adenosylcobinamide-GDP ribazoletransferase [Candidatus Hodgkinia cicadicola]|nr:Adenosylcobinamide-GDP ribazoletransferase [Candidatus Hodgkinia cicadicola]
MRTTGKKNTFWNNDSAKPNCAGSKPMLIALAPKHWFSNRAHEALTPSWANGLRFRLKTATTNALTQTVSFIESAFNKLKNCVALLTILPVYNLRPMNDFLQPILIVAIVTQMVASAALAFGTSDVDIILYITLKRLLQGCVYEDGLADVADSSGRHTKQAKLTIIKGSKTGAFGMLSLMLLFTTEYVLLKRLSPAKAIKTTTICNLIGYSSMLWHWTCLPHAYDSHKLILRRNNAIVCAITVCALLFVYFDCVRAIVVIIQIITLNIWFNVWSLANLAGCTGDTLGTIKLLSEMLSFVGLSA